VNSGPRRGVVLASVILLHAGLAAVVVVALRSQSRASRDDLVSTLIFLAEPAPATPTPQPEDYRQPRLAPMSSTAITLPPMTQPGTDGAVDWDAEAQAAGAAAIRPRSGRPLDHNPASEAAPNPASPSVAVHHAGEQYTERDGTRIVWVSDRCFVASSPPPPGVPDIVARAIPTNTVCRGDPGWSRPDLFKDLPAYQRYHPQEAAEPLPDAARRLPPWTSP
jgi:hypothetical protein